MKTTFLEFEQPVAELEGRIDELRYAQDDSAVDISEEIQRLSKKSQALTRTSTASSRPGRWRRSRAIRSGRTRSTSSA
jgi:acetyl-CoA carboxylase carboxyl transferase subunit alpha